MITFLSPWILAALAVVPALWWLLRVTPPKPRDIIFPAFFLLKDLKAEITTAARTPWWLLVLRALMVVLFILALADPVKKLTGGLPGSGGSVIVSIDNGWAAAAHWRERQDKLKEIMPRIGRSGRSVILLPTAPSETDGKVHALGPFPADEALKVAERLRPQPWAQDDATAAAAIGKAAVSHAVFLSDGTAAEGVGDLMTALGKSGGLTVVRDDKVNDPHILRKKPGAFAFEIERLNEGAATLSLMAFGADGGVLDELKVDMPAGKLKTDVTWDMLPQMRAQVERVTLRQPSMASATFLTDSRWRQHPVGIVSDAGKKDSKSFLNEVYYLRRALEGSGSIGLDVPSELMKSELSAIIWPDSAAVTASEREALLAWVEGGGFLVRFAGPGLAANPEDPLLPVKLRYGQRSMEGAMTWEKPVKLGMEPEGSPLGGLAVPDDVTVTRQLLAEPSPESFEKTWLQLEDGTPLITGGHVGKGMVVLVHTTAGPAWSNFCYSGLFVEALQRMVSLSAGIGDYKARSVLPPLMLMDGFGQLQPPDDKGIAAAVDPAKEFVPAPASPPGLYGDRQEFQVFNLGDHLSQMRMLSVPVDASTEGYALSGERSLKADFFAAALILLLVETLVTFWLRGVFARAGMAAVVVALVLHAGVAHAADPEDSDLASGIYLAYVETGDQDTDQTSYNGLTGLAQVLKTRTTIDVKGVRGVDPASDSLYYYPFLYWPMNEAQGPLSGSAARNLQNYMSAGGMIVFDTRDAQYDMGSGAATPGTRKLREVAKSLDVPELMPVEDGHILTKSFYLLHSFPGRFASDRLWVEKEPNQSYDAVTSVIIGSGDYAAAWSRDGRDRARFDISGGERQREMAYRVGVNITMTALAGNYKADQVHVPYILERLGR